VFDAMPSLGRKFLLAGKSGLNLTHAEAFEAFCQRFGGARDFLQPALNALTPDDLRGWAADLGIETFIGSSGRVFPTRMKASPLLRAWLTRLSERNVTLHKRHRWLGWQPDGELVFETPDGVQTFAADAVVLALGGASWPRLGSTGGWVSILAQRGIEIAPLRSANCGFDVDWSDHFRARCGGMAVKSVALDFAGQTLRGDFVITRHGIEGSAVYALSAALREAIERQGGAALAIDLAPDRRLERLTEALTHRRPKSSMATHLRKSAGISGVKAALLRECRPAAISSAATSDLARAIKSLPLTLRRTRPLAEAISSAGGISLEELTCGFMLRRVPGVFAAGEMLAWEAPTGGYLLTACFATGAAAGRGAAAWAGRPRR